MKHIIATAIMLLAAVTVTLAQTDSTKKRRDNTRVKTKPRGDRKSIIGKDTAGWPHNRTPQWPHDSMLKSSNKVERLNHKKDTVNTLKKP